MPAVKEIQLVCTPEEWNQLVYCINYMGRNSQPAFKSLKDKISEINKRLVFASSKPD